MVQHCQERQHFTFISIVSRLSFITFLGSISYRSLSPIRLILGQDSSHGLMISGEIGIQDDLVFSRKIRMGQYGSFT